MQCPKCGGTNLKPRGSARGVTRYKCGSQRRNEPVVNGCGWHGTMPVGVEDAKAVGIPRAAANALASKVRNAKGVKRYVITAAQNATPVHLAFWQSLRTYCERNDAELLVIPYRYKNPTSRWSEAAQTDDWWASEVLPHLIDKRVHLNDNLTLVADIKTQPTAGSPLQGFETITGGRSGIFGHPKLELSCIPTPQQKLPKILTTTGACTVPNYIPSKAGKQGEHHHTLGACVVGIASNKIFHLRQLNALPDGSFCDLDREYSGNNVTPAQPEGLVMGDVHVEFADPQAVEGTFGDEGIVTVLKPKRVVWHDVLDSYAGSHHHGVFTRYAKHHSGRANVRAELERCFDFISEHSRLGAIQIFVNSNHHNHLARWVKETDPRLDPENAVFWAHTFAAMCEGTKMGPYGAEVPDPFLYWAREILGTSNLYRFLRADESYRIAGIEVGMHGDVGPNGSRGSIKSMGKIGVKSVIGHSHTPGIKDGVYQVGTKSRLRLEYTHGPSSWLNTDCLIYKNGKRTLINIIEGSWRV